MFRSLRQTILRSWGACVIRSPKYRWSLRARFHKARITTLTRMICRRSSCNALSRCVQTSLSKDLRLSFRWNNGLVNCLIVTKSWLSSKHFSNWLTTTRARSKLRSSRDGINFTSWTYLWTMRGLWTPFSSRCSPKTSRSANRSPTP